MRSVKSKYLVFVILCLIISGCSTQEEEAKKLGFASVEQMTKLRGQGYKKMDDYLSHLLINSECAGLKEVRAAIQQEGESCVNKKEYDEIRRKESELERQRLIEAQRLAEQAENEKFSEGKIYEHSLICKNVENKVCIEEREYEYLCKKSVGITNYASMSIAPSWLDRVAWHLNENGGYQGEEIRWGEYTRRNESTYRCIVDVLLSGVYEGTQYKKIMEGTASSFIKKDGKIFVHYISPSL